AERSGLGWRTTVWLAVLVLALLALCFGREPFPQTARAGMTDAAARPPLPAAFWAYWIVMLLIVSTEFCILLWGADFLATVVGLTRSAAAAALSGFLLAVVVGRIVGSRLAGYNADARLFLGALAITGAGFGIYWLAGWAPLNIAGLVVAGLGVANLYPLALALAVGVVPEQADLASARCALAAGIAILLAPLLLAALADQVGIRTAYAVVIPLLVAALLISQRAQRMVARRVAPWPTPELSDSGGRVV
ncbi:MAG: MFS transporter, partial [Chloroflexota bacterium]|nr:MFS transporter [Chloroflexota bacterium]